MGALVPTGWSQEAMAQLGELKVPYLHRPSPVFQPPLGAGAKVAIVWWLRLRPRGLRDWPQTTELLNTKPKASKVGFLWHNEGAWV